MMKLSRTRAACFQAQRQPVSIVVRSNAGSGPPAPEEVKVQPDVAYRTLWGSFFWGLLPVQDHILHALSTGFIDHQLSGCIAWNQGHCQGRGECCERFQICQVWAALVHTHCKPCCCPQMRVCPGLVCLTNVCLVTCDVGAILLCY